MKGIFSKVQNKLLALLPKLALILATSSVESFCFFWPHQPDVPKELLDKSKIK